MEDLKAILGIILKNFKKKFEENKSIFEKFSKIDYEDLNNDFYIYFNDFSNYKNYLNSEALKLFKENKNKENIEDYFIIGYDVADSVYLYKKNNIYLLENTENLDILYFKNDNKKSKIKYLFSFDILKEKIL